MFEFDTQKINNTLKEKLPILYEFNFNGILFLCGGALKDIYMEKEPKDFDFVLLTQNNDNIKEFIQSYNLEYKINSYGGYKINYNGIMIDLWSVNDLFKSIQYNIDGLFYDVTNNTLIPFGFYDCFEQGKIIELNPNTRHPQQDRNMERKQKVKTFFNHYKK